MHVSAVVPGLPNLENSRTAPHHEPESAQVWYNTREQMAFNFFNLQTAPYMSGITKREAETIFWKRWVPQVALRAPSVKYAMCALGSFHHSFLEGQDDRGQAAFLFAQQAYAKAIQSTVIGIGVHQISVDVSVVICILFTMCEKLLGNVDTAVIHLRAGLKLLQHGRSHERSCVASIHPLRHTAYVLLRRLAGQLLLIGWPCLGHDEIRPLTASPAIPSIFYSLEEASNTLEDLANAVLNASYVPSWDYIEIDNTQQQPACVVASQYIPAFKRWLGTFNRFVHHTQPEVVAINGENQSAVLMLYSWQKILRIFLYLDASAGEMGFDAFKDDFAIVVKYCSTILRAQQNHSRCKSAGSHTNQEGSDGQLPHPEIPLGASRYAASYSQGKLDSPEVAQHEVSMRDNLSTQSAESRSRRGTYTSRSHDPILTLAPLSPIGALYITAHRCRDPTIRRSAIRLLHDCEWEDGMWSSHVAAVCAERLMQLEEAGCLVGPDRLANKHCVSRADQVPVEDRCDLIKLRYQDSHTILVDFVNIENYVWFTGGNGHVNATANSLHEQGLIRQSLTLRR